MSQGMATTQGFTATAEGLDQKLALHVWSRAALAVAMLPALNSDRKKVTTPCMASIMRILTPVTICCLLLSAMRLIPACQRARCLSAILRILPSHVAGDCGCGHRH